MARTIGCCGHAPAKWRESWHDLLRAPLTFRAYRPKPLDIKFPLIPVIHRMVDRCIPQSPEFDEIDAWAVPVSKVASVTGSFHADDLKDYLGIPPTKKLLLSTCASDRYQEMLWRRGHLMDYKNHGIDYWFPAHFSIYDGDSKMYQFASARRQQRNALDTQSQFLWFHRGSCIPNRFLTRQCRPEGVLIYTAQMRSARARDIVQSDVKGARSAYPDVPLFFVGGRRGLATPDGVKCYEVNSQWLRSGLRGYRINGEREHPKGGGYASDELTALLRSNLRATIQQARQPDRKEARDGQMAANRRDGRPRRRAAGPTQAPEAPTRRRRAHRP